MVIPHGEYPPGFVFLTGKVGAVYVDGQRVRLFSRFVCGDWESNRGAVRGCLDGIAHGLTLRDAPERGPGCYVRVGLRSFAWVAEQPA